MSANEQIRPILLSDFNDRIRDAETKALKIARARISVRRARSLQEEPIALPVEPGQADKAVEELSAAFEKIHLQNNLLPATFLRQGSIRCDAVCRIVVRDSRGILGYGTGFLVAKGILLTNNHVLPSAQSAISSKAEFFYEDGRDPVVVALQPDLCFLSSPDLDYTFVGCDPDHAGLGSVQPVEISRNPATIAEGESINIIQHPAGRRKEVALHENQVTSILNKVVRYRTDTEPGSSGSAAFNNSWQLVALHHAGWNEAGGAAINEGVRISAIAADLAVKARTDSKARDLAGRVLGDGNEVSPYLGFFDLAGAGGSDLEVEIPDFTGDRDFADVGFWNIEHFNGSVSDDRVRTIKSVLQRLSMDVMGLTEVEEPALKRLVDEMLKDGDRYAYVVRDASGRQDIAALYDADTTSVEMAEDIYVKFAESLDSKTQGGASAFPRLPLFARCKVADGNTAQVQFLLIVVHLKAFGDAVSQARRRLASEVLATIIEEVRSEGLPIVLGGDFNDAIDANTFSALRDAPDLFALTADDATGDAISYVGASHRSLIDHIVVSRDAKLGTIQGDDAAIVRLDKTIADFATNVSDHVPVIVRLVYRDEAVVGSGTGSDGGEALVSIPSGATKVRLSFTS